MGITPRGFDVKDSGYIAPSKDGSKINVIVSHDSQRLQLLKPFLPGMVKILSELNC